MRDLFSDPGTAKTLRPHQERALAMLKSSLAGKAHRAPVLQLATGAGKTRIAAEIINGALSKGNRVAFTVPAISLVDQTVRALEDEGITHINVIQAKHPRKDPYARVHVVSVQSLMRRDRPAVDLVIVDEAHLRFRAISKWIHDAPDLPFVGLSATPWARGMADDWDDLLVPVRMQDLIDDGWLSPFRVFAPSHPDLAKVRTVAGDYHEGDLSAVMSDNRLVADVVQTWRKLAAGLPTLVFAVDRAHAETLQRRFEAAGIPMGYCDAYTDRLERKTLFDRMARGDLAGICNVGTLTTGVDADVRCVVMARPTKSEMLFVQCIGRGLRTADGKDHCVIIDHADNHARLGFVTDIHHDRLFTGKDRAPPTAREKGEKTPNECPKCGALRHGLQCLACGFVAQRVSEIEHEDGELVEVKARKVKFTAVDKQRFWSELLAVAKQRGRSRGWASHAYREKTGVWPRGLEDRLAVPSAETLGFVKHKDIAFAKRRTAA